MYWEDRCLQGAGYVGRWPVPAFQGCTVLWGAGQGAGRAIAVPRISPVGWVVLLLLRVRDGYGAIPGYSKSLELHPSTPYAPCALARWQGRGAAWDSQGGQSRLFTAYHTSGEITSALSAPPASCLVNPYLCHAHVGAARRQGAGRRCGQGYPAGSGAR